jgi:hypothetical protein
MILIVICQNDGDGIGMTIRKSTNQVIAYTISIFLMFLLCNGACSQEEKPLPPLHPQKVVKVISKAPGLKGEKKTQVNESLKSKLEKKGAAETKPALVQEGELEKPKIVTEETPPKEEKGYYVVMEGDTLSGIAGRKDIYGDPLKWPILGRHNVDMFNHMPAAEDLPDRMLREGARLKIITQDEVKKNLEEMSKRRWVVNVLSSQDNKEVIPVVASLIRVGFPVYVTRAKVNGKNYMRVRVGFFADKTEAEVEGKRLVEVLNLSDFWTIRVGEKEAQEFGGY